MVKFRLNYASKMDFDEKDYFDYDRLKRLIRFLNHEAPEDVQERLINGLTSLTPAFGRIEQTPPQQYHEIKKSFLDEFMNEVRHVNNFFVSKQASVSNQLDYLTDISTEENDTRATLYDPSTSNPDSHPEESNNMKTRLLLHSAGGDESPGRRSVRLDANSPSSKPYISTSITASDSYDIPIATNTTTTNSAVSTYFNSHDSTLRRLVKPSFSVEDMYEKKAEQGSLKRSLDALFKDLERLESFRLLNHTAFIKILKKFDKVHDFRQDVDAVLSGEAISLHDTIISTLDKKYEVASFESLNKLTLRAESLYAAAFCKGDVVEAHGKIRLSKGAEPLSKKAHLGFKAGIFTTLCCWFFFDMAVRPTYTRDIWGHPALYVFAFAGNIIAYRWFWAFTVEFWQSAHVNYILLLRFSDKNAPHSETLYDDATNLSIAYLICFILFLDTLRDPSGHLFGSIPPYTFLILLFPLLIVRFGYSYLCAKEFHGIFSIRVLQNLLTPWRANSLKDRYAADMLCSLSRELVLTVYSSCYVFTGQFLNLHETANLESTGQCSIASMDAASAVLMIIPILIRFFQTLRSSYDSGENRTLVWPHGYNSIKYALSILIVLLGTFKKVTTTSSEQYRMFFIIVCLAVTLYQAWYDMFVDWGLGRVWPSSFQNMLTGDELIPPNFLLRPRLMFERKTLYYLIIVLNPILRLVWTFSLLPSDSTLGQWTSRISPMLCVIELFRRFLWSCLKMEKDHIDRSESWYASLGGKDKQGPKKHQIGRAKTATHAGIGMVIQTHDVPFHFGERRSTRVMGDNNRRLRYIFALLSMSTSAVLVNWIIAIGLSS